MVKSIHIIVEQEQFHLNAPASVKVSDCSLTFSFVLITDCTNFNSNPIDSFEFALFRASSPKLIHSLLQSARKSLNHKTHLKIGNHFHLNKPHRYLSQLIRYVPIDISDDYIEVFALLSKDASPSKNMDLIDSHFWKHFSQTI